MGILPWEKDIVIRKRLRQTWVEKQLKHSGLEHIFIRNGSHHWQFDGSRKARILKFSLPVRMINSLYFLLQPKWRDANACRLSYYVTAFLSRYVLAEWWLFLSIQLTNDNSKFNGGSSCCCFWKGNTLYLIITDFKHLVCVPEN